MPAAEPTGFERCRGAAVFMKALSSGHRAAKIRKVRIGKGFKAVPLPFPAAVYNISLVRGQGLGPGMTGCGKAVRKRECNINVLHFLPSLMFLRINHWRKYNINMLQSFSPLLPCRRGGRRGQARTVRSFFSPSCRSDEGLSGRRKGKGAPGIGSQGGDRWLSGRRRRNREERKWKIWILQKNVYFCTLFSGQGSLNRHTL